MKALIRESLTFAAIFNGMCIFFFRKRIAKNIPKFCVFLNISAGIFIGLVIGCAYDVSIFGIEFAVKSVLFLYLVLWRTNRLLVLVFMFLIIIDFIRAR